MNIVERILVVFLLAVALVGLWSIVVSSRAHADPLCAGYEDASWCQGPSERNEDLIYCATTREGLTEGCVPHRIVCREDGLCERVPFHPRGEVGLVYGCVEGSVSYELTTAWADPGFPIDTTLNGESWISTTVDSTGIFFMGVSLKPGDVVTINGFQLNPIEDIQCEAPVNDTGGDGGVELDTPQVLERTGTVATTTSRELPRTGLSATTLALLAAVLLGAGAVTLGVTRVPSRSVEARVTQR